MIINKRINGLYLSLLSKVWKNPPTELFFGLLWGGMRGGGANWYESVFP